MIHTIIIKTKIKNEFSLFTSNQIYNLGYRSWYQFTLFRTENIRYLHSISFTALRHWSWSLTCHSKHIREVFCNVSSSCYTRFTLAFINSNKISFPFRYLLKSLVLNSPRDWEVYQSKRERETSGHWIMEHFLNITPALTNNHSLSVPFATSPQ